MSQKPVYQPTEAELEILKVIWELEPASVRAIHERIAEGKNVGYTTVLKQIQRLTEEKGVLEKVIVDGTHLYRSTIRETDMKRGRLRAGGRSARARAQGRKRGIVSPPFRRAWGWGPAWKRNVVCRKGRDVRPPARSWSR